MSLIDFWTNVKTASGFISPSVEVDSSQLNGNNIQQVITSAVIWLTPRAVQGFDEDDFIFLSKKEQAELKQCVTEFKIIADSVPRNQPASKESIERAEPAFRRIIEILQIDTYENAEYYRIAKLLDALKQKLPKWVKDIKYRFDYDSTGDPAVWIWVIADDTESEKKTFFDDVIDIHSIIKSTLQMHGVQLWPYLGVRTVTEQSEVEAGIY